MAALEEKEAGGDNDTIRNQDGISDMALFLFFLMDGKYTSIHFIVAV